MLHCQSSVPLSRACRQEVAPHASHRELELDRTDDARAAEVGHILRPHTAAQIGTGLDLYNRRR